ncbi:MAG: N-acetylmuramic acid 6-phosphate etherase [Planctomycetaceae bacterium]
MLDNLTTEAHNPQSSDLDLLSSHQIVELMNDEDARVAAAVRTQAAPIAGAIDAITERLRAGGRLIYVGTGTSGRLGVLDASECPPTFNTHPDQVVGLIAGGPPALTRSSEHAEDQAQQAIEDVTSLNLNPHDTLVGITASGRTPYVIHAVETARHTGAFVVGVTCNSNSELQKRCDLCIAAVVGPEVVSGSTRLKAGTATKMILNMLTTGAMVRLGKTYGNLMVDLRATNQKLIERSRRILMNLTGLSAQDAIGVLERCDGELKTAVVVHMAQLNPDAARNRLVNSNGRLRQALHPRDPA